MYFVAIVLDLVDNRTKGQSSLQRDSLRYRGTVLVTKGHSSLQKERPQGGKHDKQSSVI